MLSGDTIVLFEPRGKTSDIIAKKIGVSGSTYNRAKSAIEEIILSLE